MLRTCGKSSIFLTFLVTAQLGTLLLESNVRRVQSVVCWLLAVAEMHRVGRQLLAESAPGAEHKLG
jgi:hypothetical protein